MDHVARLARELSATLAELHEEAERQQLRRLHVPLAWLDEANRWLKYELVRETEEPRDSVPFDVIPIGFSPLT